MKVEFLKGRFTKAVPDWSELRIFARSKVLHSSYIWLLIVPLLAKALEHAPNNIDGTLFGKAFHVRLALPFSWAALFFCAFMVTIGNVFYQWKCPRLVRDFETYSQFRDAGLGFERLRRMWELPEEFGIEDTFPRTGSKVLEISSPRLQQFISLLANHREPSSGAQAVQMPLPSEEELSEMFGGYYGPLNGSRLRWRAVCAFFYGLGLIFMILMLLQNLHFVLRHLPPLWPTN